ncbi:hypothetical protein [Streptomyces kronopolitis]|uniref:hypothetical protein n=1 Tax=Streptomyces kronopolitis TaxID=1612435 RepID=UPI003D95EAA5
MRVTFQQSRIWEAGNPVDPNTDKVTVKVPPGKGEASARRRLPQADTGRVWVLVGTTGAANGGQR